MCLRLPGNKMPKKADTRIADAGQCQRQAHQTWLRRMLCVGQDDHTNRYEDADAN